MAREKKMPQEWNGRMIDVLEMLVVEMAVILISEGKADRVIADLATCPSESEAIKIAQLIICALPDDKVAEFMFALNRAGEAAS